MKKPRTTFAAPFVLVIGCGQPQEHASSPHRHHHHRPRVAEATVDAGEIDAVVDAPPDAISDGVPMDVQCAQPWKYKVICNPAPPQGPVPPGWPGYKPTGNPPPPIHRIIKNAIDGAAVEVTVSGGSDEGVSDDWKATVVDDRGIPVQGGEGTILRVMKRQTIIRVELTIDQVERAQHVRLTPP